MLFVGTKLEAKHICDDRENIQCQYWEERVQIGWLDSMPTMLSDGSTEGQEPFPGDKENHSVCGSVE